MGGKSEIINYKRMAELYSEGCNGISDIRSAIENIEKRITILRSSHVTGENGVSYRQSLNAIYVALNELSRSTEKASIFMDAKLSTAKNTQNDSAMRKKANYLSLKK